MCLAYKLAQLALLPGVWILVSLCVIALLLRSPARSVAARRLAIATALGFLALSSHPLPALLVRALERRFPPIAPASRILRADHKTIDGQSATSGMC